MDDNIARVEQALDDRTLTVALIPETLQRTTLGLARPGTQLNVEVDVLAKHVEKLLRAHLAGAPA